MKFFAFAILLVAVYAEDFTSKSKEHFDSVEYLVRDRRDTTFSRPVGENGKVIGTLGETGKGGLFGEAGYQHNVFNDDRGKLDVQAYGTRVLNPNKDSTYYGGRANWENDHFTASADARQRIGGRARMDLEAGGRWEPFKNAEVAAKSYYSHREGRPSDYGGKVDFTYRGW